MANRKDPTTDSTSNLLPLLQLENLLSKLGGRMKPIKTVITKMPGAYVLKKLTNCELKEIKAYKNDVYEWRGVFFEVVGYDKKTAPASHYTTIKAWDEKWSVRELGDKSQLLIDLKKNER